MAHPETPHQHVLYRGRSPQKTAGKLRVSFDYVSFFTASRRLKSNSGALTSDFVISQIRISFFRASRCRKNESGIFTPHPIVSRVEIPFSTTSRRLKIDSALSHCGSSPRLEKITSLEASRQRKNDFDTLSPVRVVSRAMILFFLTSKLYECRSPPSDACSCRFTCSDPLRGFSTGSLAPLEELFQLLSKSLPLHFPFFDELPPILFPGGRGHSGVTHPP